MQQRSYPPASGPFAKLSEEEKQKRLAVMVSLWQHETERRIDGEDYRTFITAVGLDEYRYSVWLRFPEWDRSVVVGQVITLGRSQSGAPEDPAIYTTWRREPLLKSMPDWKAHLPKENVFNLSVRITPGGLGEGTRWAVVMPKDMIARYKPGWPTQREWVAWTQSFDWLSVAIGFLRAMLDSL